MSFFKFLICFLTEEKNRDFVITVIPGVLGALLSLYYTKPLCFYKGVVSFLGGAISAMFIAPAVAHGYGMHMTNAAAFLVGTFFMSVIGIIFQVVEKFSQSPVRTLKTLRESVIDVLLAFKHGRIRKDGEKNGTKSNT